MNRNKTFEEYQAEYLKDFLEKFDNDLTYVKFSPEGMASILARLCVLEDKVDSLLPAKQ